ncbi:MAG: hypothetical protein AAGA32_14160 [Pseudomonadota bacterium]
MSVDAVLKKLCVNTQGVCCAVLTTETRIASHLPGIYSALRPEDVAEFGVAAFATMDELEDYVGTATSTVFDFQNHSVMVRRIEDAILVLFLEPMRRAQVRKLRIGVNLFVKPLLAALAETPALPAPPPAERAEPVVAEPLPEPDQPHPAKPLMLTDMSEPPATPPKPQLSPTKSKKRRFYRGVEY